MASYLNDGTQYLQVGATQPAVEGELLVKGGFALGIWWLLGSLGILLGWAWLDEHQVARELQPFAPPASLDTQYFALAPALLSGASTHIDWQHLSTATGDLPLPSASTQQVLTLSLIHI